jgi:predicted acetyltransferase
VPVPFLVLPTLAVRNSLLAGEREVCDEEHLPASWLDEAAADFDAFVDHRRDVRQLWDVPVTELWFVDGSTYLGTVIIRHRLPPALERVGGHIGFHVVPRHRRRGYATRMLADAVVFCRHLGLTEVLITCAEDNRASHRVIESNGGVLEGVVAGERRYWLRF